MEVALGLARLRTSLGPVLTLTMVSVYTGERTSENRSEPDGEVMLDRAPSPSLALYRGVVEVELSVRSSVEFGEVAATPTPHGEALTVSSVTGLGRRNEFALDSLEMPEVLRRDATRPTARML